jgi:DNA-binding PadR family transcriptional regulator
MAGGPTGKRSVAMRSPLNWTLLGLVIERPSYGYELWTRFERLYGDVLVSRSQSHAYSALDALHERGFVEKVPPSVGQGKLYYRVTQAGLKAHRGWMIEQIREHHRRSREFARQLAAFAEHPEAALELLAEYERACLEERGGAIPTAKLFPTPADPGLGDELASAWGRAVVNGTLNGVDYARAVFSELASKQRHPR